jgi:hypothetical protein
MKSKGQVTVFIIIGIVLIILFAIILTFMNLKPENTSYGNENINVEVFVDSCLEGSINQATKLIAFQGGYLILPQKNVTTENFMTAYGIYENNDTLISINGMELQLAEYLNLAILNCVNNFTEFKGKEIIFEKPKTKVSIDLEKISINVKFPIDIKSENDNTHIENFDDSLNIPLGRVHSIAKKVIEKQLENPDWIDLSYNSNFLGDINFIPVDSENIVVTILYEDLLFTFGEKILINKPPKLNVYNNIEINDGSTWVGKINCTDPDGDYIKITDDSGLVSTTYTGELLLQPEIPGIYNITFTCSDGNYNSDSKSITITVK